MSILEVQVKPNTKQQKIDKTDAGIWVVYLRSPPVDGKANKELIQLIAKELGLPKSRISIKAGANSRRKWVEVLVEP
ncbi:DUF167 domain-containing protein [Pseudanabaena sp. FACHB-2040]|uniref:DUF167 domain-containing protein n=1 Tax=Pseudanabaena sp. FACHB-2040 TaxID=2692859 RepID=UPI0016843232|nr:DUF167 domain-containing protein [Pseudanabaena sp. FACHB-2040]MBD2259797.1 DUF167 domain-containing protein [Pseudanabaena sp. FACHB-2040]